MCPSDALQAIEELGHFGIAQRARQRPHAFLDGLVHLSQQVESFLGHIADDLPAVVGRAFAADELFRLQPVEQASNTRGLVNHALDDFQCRKAFLTSAARNSDDIVLLEGDTTALRRGGWRETSCRAGTADFSLADIISTVAILRANVKSPAELPNCGASVFARDKTSEHETGARRETP